MKTSGVTHTPPAVTVASAGAVLIVPVSLQHQVTPCWVFHIFSLSPVLLFLKRLWLPCWCRVLCRQSCWSSAVSSERLWPFYVDLPMKLWWSDHFSWHVSDLTHRLKEIACKSVFIWSLNSCFIFIYGGSRSSDPQTSNKSLSVTWESRGQTSVWHTPLSVDCLSVLPYTDLSLPLLGLCCLEIQCRLQWGLKCVPSCVNCKRILISLNSCLALFNNLSKTPIKSRKIPNSGVVLLIESEFLANFIKKSPFAFNLSWCHISFTFMVD